MADKEIGALTSADDLTGTEILHLVQGGNSRKGTVAKIADFVASLATRILATSAKKATVGVRILEEEVTLTGSSVDASFLIPDRSIVLCVSSRTTVAITGASSYSVGYPGETSKFGGGLGVAANSSNRGVIGPTAVYADQVVRITGAGGSFTGGKVRISAAVLTFDAPTA